MNSGTALEGGLAQALDVAKGAASGEKDVHHEVHVVEQNPLAVAAALDGVGVDGEVALEAQPVLAGKTFDQRHARI